MPKKLAVYGEANYVIYKDDYMRAVAKAKEQKDTEEKDTPKRKTINGRPPAGEPAPTLLTIWANKKGVFCKTVKLDEYLTMAVYTVTLPEGLKVTKENFESTVDGWIDLNRRQNKDTIVLKIDDQKAIDIMNGEAKVPDIEILPETMSEEDILSDILG